MSEDTKFRSWREIERAFLPRRRRSQKEQIEIPASLDMEPLLRGPGDAHFFDPSCMQESSAESSELHLIRRQITQLGARIDFLLKNSLLQALDPSSPRSDASRQELSKLMDEQASLMAKHFDRRSALKAGEVDDAIQHALSVLARHEDPSRDD